MRHLFRASLILLLVVTGIALGQARGQGPVAGRVVLCAGGAVMTVMVDRDGQPVQTAQVCPDMALSLLAGMPPDSSPAAARRVPRGVAWPQPARAAWAAERVPSQARGPPLAA